ncbi:hypothetical protein [Paenibacillus agricola]|uniref:Uncharacterized protein n=1 Tax=Paenibacillus agricola TaxID=2716264 RepID=A0ABX0J6N9_9BACL|nr:hypothetical protein [Paenibacillus agricola]NHN31075.1 hypothetical protein [Paenibacillus agricola]
MKRTRRVRSTRKRTPETIKPYLKTTEVKGLYAPDDDVESAAVAQAAPAANQGFSFLNGIGGIDGMLSMMGKAQQMFKLFQQMGPMFRMLNSFGGAQAVTASLRKSMRQSRLSQRRKAKIRKN